MTALCWRSDESKSALPARQAPVSMQLDIVIEQVQNVSAVAESVPAGVEVPDLSALTDAETELLDVREDVEDREGDIERFLDTVRALILVFGALSFGLGIWGFITVAGRVCPLPLENRYVLLLRTTLATTGASSPSPATNTCWR